MTKFDFLPVSGDPDLTQVQASKYYRDVMHLLNYLENHLCPMSDDEQRSIGVVEERDIENTSVLADEVFEIYPLVSVNELCHH
jgi:hypothetical protein